MYITINKDIIFHEENEEAILVNMVQNYFHGLDYVGTVVWKALQKESQLDSIVAQVSKEFNVTSKEIKSDIRNFLVELSKVGVITIV